MRTDLDYLKKMLTVFLDSESTFITVNQLRDAGFDIASEKGMFHYMQLIEQGFISNMKMETRDPLRLGYVNFLAGMRTVDAVSYTHLRRRQRQMCIRDRKKLAMSHWLL